MPRIFYLRFILRNLGRHPLRTGLTIAGIVVAVLAFGILRTVVDTWYAGAEATSARRLITRNAVSLTFPLPISYLGRIRRTDSVETVSYANWFAGVYLNEKNFFPQFAVEAKGYLDLYPEFLLPPAELRDFLHDRKGAVAGERVAAQYGWKIGDVIPLRGTIYPGEWSFVLRGIYRGRDPKTDETNFFFHWDHLNETLKQGAEARADHTGIFIVGIEHGGDAAQVSRDVSALVIGIILAVLCNTMAMSVRERRREHATLRALGFGPVRIVGLILGESLAVALLGGVLGVLLSYPAAEVFAAQVGTLFPVFEVSDETAGLAIGCVAAVGVLAALLAAPQAVRVPIVVGLRGMG
ncbi:MAG: FtsX-like permease family protein [Beggiatoa sp.]|nr:FtsX-like permease family protein [Beggiatoa sp.]